MRAGRESPSLLVRAARFAAERPTVGSLALRYTSSKLRILGYHEVTDPVIFACHLDLVSARLTPVTSGDVIAHVTVGQPLPPRATWITFDDGHPSVVEHALPLLAARGLQAAMFVCPGVVNTHEPFWWEGAPTSVLPSLKRLPDGHRRIAASAYDAPPRPQVTTAELERWVSSGMTLGNHSWDHPVLPMADSTEQESQIVRAHDWLLERFGPDAARLFAYPNGDHSTAAEEVLRRLNYQAAVTFDHRLCSTGQDALRLSRLRLDADASLPRARSIVSGAHPALFAASRWARQPGLSRRRQHACLEAPSSAP